MSSTPLEQLKIFVFFEMNIYLTDSRSLTDATSTTFVALVTAGNDGHRYIPQLYEKGVRRFIVSRMPDLDMPDAEVILVDDTEVELQRIAAEHRQTLTDTKVIGITGSVGKTTLKEWIYRSLAVKDGATRSPRSFNSQIGVPLSILSVSPDDRLAIIEAGVSQKGEMARLQPVVRPDIGIITPITDEHNEGFDSLDEKIEQKLSLFVECPVLIYPDDTRITAMLDLLEFKGARYSYPTDNMSVAAKIALDVAGETYDTIVTPEISTRFEIFDGFNDCCIIRDRFTPDAANLDAALDFMHRQQTPIRTNTLILTRTVDSDNLTQIFRSICHRNLDRLILIGYQSDMQLPGDIAGEHIAIDSYSDVDQFLSTVSTDTFDHELMLIYGDDERIDSITSYFERQQNETVLEVDLNAVVHNFNMFRSIVTPDTGIICMLKADGYGAGSYQLARTLQSQGAAYIAVAVIDEGVSLRKNGITMPLIVLNPRAANTKTMFEYHLEPEVYSLDTLADFGARARRLGYKDFPVHLKFDTGMHRLGFVPDDIPQIANIIARDKSLKVASVFSHLATADCLDMDSYTRAQLSMFDSIVTDLRNALPQHSIKAHILNSTGIFRYPGHRHDMVRLGIGLYGQPTVNDSSQPPLKPISALYSVVISLKRYKKGDTIGYGRRGVLTRDSIIATIPVGYADGLNRHLGCGVGKVAINGQRCPIVGTVCMDICMVDVTDLDEHSCSVGDRVEIFGPHIAVSELANELDTITYEVLTSISSRVKRVYYRE